MVTKFKRAEGTIFLRGVPKATRDFFHSACVKRGKTMKFVLIEFMREYAKESNKIKPSSKNKKSIASKIASNP